MGRLKIARSCKRSLNIVGSRRVVSLVVQALGTVALRLKHLTVDKSIALIQISALLGSVGMVRKVLEM